MSEIPSIGYCEMGLPLERTARDANTTRLFFNERFPQTETYNRVKTQNSDSPDVPTSELVGKKINFQEERRLWQIDYSDPDILKISILNNSIKVPGGAQIILTVNSGINPCIEYYVGPTSENYKHNSKSKRLINNPFITNIARRIILKIP